jgi:hypothetical protein
MIAAVGGGGAEDGAFGSGAQGGGDDDRNQGRSGGPGALHQELHEDGTEDEKRDPVRRENEQRMTASPRPAARTYLYTLASAWA